MKKIKMLKSVKGAPDNLNVFSYMKDKVYPNKDVPLSEELYGVFINNDFAEDYTEPQELIKRKQKMLRKTPQNKANNVPENKKEVTMKDLEGLKAGQIRALAAKNKINLMDVPANKSAKELMTIVLERQ